MEAKPKPLDRRIKTYQWQFRTENAELARLFQESMRLNPVVARVLANRGACQTAAKLEDFIHPALAKIHDPFALHDMEPAVERIAHAIQAKEKITVYGDYDTDGVTATALLLKAFQFLSVNADYYIPHRIEEGYGLNNAAIDALAASGTRLLVTVDNGITANEQVLYAKAKGMDVVVTDHHQPGADLPEAVAVVDPSRWDCLYPNKCLAGVGVAFKLAHALLKRFQIPPQKATPFLRSLLELVAIGTIADVVPVSGENRIFVRHGLEQIANSTSPGIGALRQLLQSNGGRLNTQTVGFQIAPRINAAGRTDHARICVELLTTPSEQRAREIAQRLDMLNRERRTLESRIFEECLRYIDRHVTLENERILVVHSPGWHVGVIGIVASKLLEIYDRPVIVISEHEGIGKGSARSIPSLNICEALQACSPYLIGFGGHPYAAGLSLPSDKIQAFRSAINDYAQFAFKDTTFTPSMTIDTPVTSRELDLGLIQGMMLLEPYGTSNPVPLLAMHNLHLTDNPRIVGTNHLKLQLACDQRHFGAIGFNLGSLANPLSENRRTALDVAFVPIVNDYYSQGRVELEIKDLKIGTANG